MTLAELLTDDRYQVAALVTTITEGYDRISMHGVRRVLLERQAAALGVLLSAVTIPMSASNTDYESRVEAMFSHYRREGVTAVAFGDLFLADIRRYREAWLDRIGMRPIFPLWHRQTPALARSFIENGFEAVLTCVDGRTLDRSFSGRRFDHQLLQDLPATVDPCGENGEFHTFVFGGPLFRDEVHFVLGEVVHRDTWYFCDLVPA